MNELSRIYGPWGEHPDHPIEDWKYEVVSGDTRRGYWEWVAARVDSSDEGDATPVRH